MRGARQFNREVQASAAQLEAMGVRGAGAMGKFAMQADKLKNFGRTMSTNVTLPIVAMGALSVKAASDWESAFAGVRKTVDATEPQLKALEGTLRNMSTQIPVSATELAGIAEAAGQLGIQTKNIAGFTRVMADLGVATNLTATDAASELAKFANITQMPQEQFGRLGATIVDLGNKMATTEADIVSMAMRVAGAGSQVGLTQAEIMSLSAGLSSVGIQAEAGGTAISQSFLKMNTAVLGGGEKLAGFAKVAGMTTDQFAKSFKDDAAGSMVSFMEGLQKVKESGGNVSEVLADLDLKGIRVQDMMMRGAGAGDLLRKSLSTGKKAWRDNTALSEEARKKYKTFASQLKILQNTVKDVGIAIGNKLLPPLSDLVKFLGPQIKRALRAFSSLPKPIQTGAAGLVVFLAVIGPLAWIIGGVASGVGSMLIVMTKLMPVMKAVVFITRVWTVALLTNPIVLIVVGIIALVAILVIAYKKIGWFHDAVDAVFSFIKDNWKLLLLILVAPIAGAVLLIVKHWGSIKSFVMGAVKAVLGFIRANWKKILALLTGPVGMAVYLIAAHWGKIKAGATAVVDWIKGAFGSLVGFIASLPGRISGAASGLFNGIKDAFKGAVNFIIRAWNSIELTLDIPDAIPGLPDSLTIGTPDIPMLASGGTATAPGLSVVGEQGPELRYLPKAASVIPLNREVVREAVGGSDRPIHTHVYLRGREIALAVSGQVADAGARA
jgi:TP901 family phage tail tape measure protein